MSQHHRSAPLFNHDLPTSAPASSAPRFRSLGDLSTASTDDLWPIPDLLPTGLCLLSSKSHAGARTLALQLALAIASDNVALDRFAPTPGQVLYLSFHEHERTFLARVRHHLGASPLPDHLAFSNDGTSWLEHGASTIASSLQDFPNTRLLVLDSLSSLFPPTRFWSVRRQQTLLDQLNHLAHEHHLCILILHSQARYSRHDPFDALACSPLLLEAIDTLLVLEHERTQAHARLSITGPLMPAHHLKLRLSTEDHLWHISEPTSNSASLNVTHQEKPSSAPDNDSHLSTAMSTPLNPDHDLSTTNPSVSEIAARPMPDAANDQEGLPNTSHPASEWLSDHHAQVIASGEGMS